MNRCDDGGVDWDMEKNEVYKNGKSQDDVNPTKNMIEETNFPDERFRKYLLNTFQHLNQSEISHVKRLDVSHLNISDLTGIQYFTALEELYCTGNHLSLLDLSRNCALTRLDCDDNQLRCLSLKNNSALATLSCEGNGMELLDVSANAKLQMLWCGENALTYFIIHVNAPSTLLIDAENNIRKIVCDKKGQIPDSALPDGFCFKRTSNWRNAARCRNVLTVVNPDQPVYYDYQVSDTRKVSFTLECR